MKVIVTEIEKRGSASSACNTNKINKEIEGIGKMIENFTASGVDRANTQDEATTKNTQFLVEDDDDFVYCEFNVHNATMAE